ncbi:NAD(P)-binding protein [Aulographum hederae CBS 113979]|uniref:NAD(P)-binding protein n=1 Tax=Aulographum hederae CBS 113979 TaxID=1176131 RepID=A0A6G1GRS8_9PEZI|nr:NAD(P)-binding protein [Aulographum hederae CBS 113979]
MTRVLLTGGSGFIAAHVLETLLKRGHSVVTTVRSQAKADKIKEAHPEASSSNLSFAIVEDIAQPGAFDEAIKSDPPFEAVIHTASPFHFNVTDVQKQLLDPAIIGTTGILKSIKKSAPTVKRVVITSSFAAIVNPSRGAWPGHTYSEADWNPISTSEAVENPANGYRASKTFAERSAWDFVSSEKPNFDIATINPPFVFGPVVHYLNSLDALNTSNQRIGAMVTGSCGKTIPPVGTGIWVDVRDVAEAHVKAMEVGEAGGKRFFITEGFYDNVEMVEVIKKHFPDLAEKLPTEVGEGAELPKEIFKIDNSRGKEILGLKYRGFEECIRDTVESVKPFLK